MHGPLNYIIQYNTSKNDDCMMENKEGVGVSQLGRFSLDFDENQAGNQDKNHIKISWQF